MSARPLETIEAFVSAYKGAGVPLEEIPQALRQERHRALLQRMEALRREEPYRELRVEVVAQQAGTWGDAEPSVRLRIAGDRQTAEGFLSELAYEFEQEAFDVFSADPKGKSRMRTVHFEEPIPLSVLVEARVVGQQWVRFLSADLTQEGRIRSVTVVTRGERDRRAFANLVRRLRRRAATPLRTEVVRGRYRLPSGEERFLWNIARVRGEEYARQKQRFIP
jgi:hypothetical protein